MPLAEGQLRFYCDPVLRTRCDEVSEFDSSTQDLVLMMATVMRGHEGVGLAAPQLGILLRVIVADIGEGLLAIVNPVIEDRKGSDRMVEGCLSLPEIHVEIERSQRIMLSGMTGRGEACTWDCSGLIARVLQHEIDHLEGVLIVDHAPMVERTLLKQRMKMLQKKHKSVEAHLVHDRSMMFDQRDL